MAEPTPGAPGGGASGPRSATAATFVVSDASLRDLRRTWQGLTQDVKNFGKAIAELRRYEGDISRLQQRLGQLGVGGAGGAGRGAGGRPAGMPPLPTARPVDLGSTIPVGRPADYNPPRPGQGGTPGGRPAGMPPLPPPRPQPVEEQPRGLLERVLALPGARPAVAVVGGTSAYMGARLQGYSGSDLLMNQLGRAQGGGYTQDRRRAEQQAVQRIGGFQSQEDLQQGVTSVTRALGGTATTGRSAGALAEAGRLTALNPDLGLAGSGQAVSSLYSAQSANRLQMMGMSSIGVGGAQRSPTAVYDDILRRSFRGSRFTARQINEGMVPGAPLQRTLDYLLPDPAAQEQFRAYAIARANSGGSSVTANRAITAAAALNRGESISGADQRLVDRAGLRDNIRTGENRVGEQSANNQLNLGEAARGGIMQGFESLADVTETLTQTFLGLNAAAGGAPANTLGFAGVLSGPVGTAIGTAGGVFGAQALGQLFGGRRRRRGRGGSDGEPGGGGGNPFGDGGGDDVRVFVTNWPDCICDGGGGGGGDTDLDGRRGRGRAGGPGRGGRLGRFGALARTGGAAVLGAGSAYAGFKVGDLASDALEERYGQRDEAGNRSMGDRLGKSAATVGKYALGGAAGGAAAGAMLGGPFGAALGGFAGLVGGTVVGLGKSIYDFNFGDNQRNDGRPQPGAPDRQERARYGFHSSYDTGSRAPRMSKGGKVAGNHTEDVVPILATPGEVVVPLPVVSRHGGAEKLMRMLGIDGVTIGGQGDAGRYAKGGKVTGKTQGLNAEFLKRLQQFAAAEGEDFNVGSGYRSIEQQKVLYDRWVRRVPGQAPAAKPGSSNHNFGLAVDGPRWYNRNPERFGLRYPMSYEPWHIEPVNAKAMRGGAPAAPGEADAAGGAENQPANGVGGSSGAAALALAGGTGRGSYDSESAALASLLGSRGGGATLGAAVAGVSSTRGAAAAEPTTASNTAGGSATTQTAPANPSGAAALGQKKAAARGWSGDEWDALYQLWQKESGWRVDAANPTSSARGIPQMMMSVHYGKDWQRNPQAKRYLSDAATQIDVGLNYIAQRYKAPSAAWKHSQARNWYEKGAVEVLQDEVAQLHAGEMVVPRKAATKLRSMIASARAGAAATPSYDATAPARVSRSVTLQITAPVTVVGQATPQDARRFLEMVKAEAETDATLDMIGSGR